MNSFFDPRALLACVLAVLPLALPTVVSGQVHSDVEFEYIGGQIVLEEGVLSGLDAQYLFEGTFPTSGPSLRTTDDPGFASEPSQGFGINVDDSIEILFQTSPTLGGALQYHDGTNFQTTSAVITVDDNSVNTIDLNISESEFTNDNPVFLQRASDTRGNAGDSPFGAGEIHSHVEFTLSAGAPLGAYGVLASLSTDAVGIEDSEPFWVIFNHGLSLDANAPINFESSVAAFQARSLLGDFDGDGDVDTDDIDYYSGNIGEAADGDLAQLNFAEDLTITLADYDFHITELVMDANGTGALIGDLNLDGDVDVSQIAIVNGQPVNTGDASVLLASLGSTTGQLYGDGDLNADGDVDISQISIVNGQPVNLGDASRLLANLGQSTSNASPASAAVPEPSSASLILAAGIAGLIRRRRNS